MSGRHSLVALAVGLALTGQAQAQLLISEYLEGSSNNKAVELSNVGSSVIDLSAYRLALYANGKPLTDAPTNSLALQGTLAPGASLVLANPSANAEILAKATQTSGNLVFNGDDALVLYRGSEIVDSFGQVGVDPGTAWVSGNVSTLDMTLRRKATVTTGRVDAASPFDPALEYVAAPKDDASGLGCSGDGPCDGTQPPAFVCPVDNLVPVPAIQGPGSSSPLVPAGKFESEQAHATRGVVTQVVSGLYKGFFIQDAQGDGDPATSDGLFVYTTKANAAVVPGAEVCVSGKVKEYFNQTQINADDLVVTQPSGAVPAAVDLVPVAGESLTELLERHEGMQVRLVPESSLVVTRNFSFDYDGKRNNLVLSYGAPLIKSTQKFAPMSEEASSWALRNQQNQLVVETDAKAPDGVLPWFPGFNAEDGYLRIGDKLNGLEGALGYSYNLFRLVANNRIDSSNIDHRGWDRVETPELAEAGDLRVASFNVLNFFTTVVGGDANPTGSNRGALTVAEFELQRTKIVSAITRLNADVVGLMEIENNGYGDNSAIANLVAALNAAQPDEADHYRWIASPDGKPIGTDAITVGLIYRPASVTPEGAASLIAMPMQQAEAQDASGKTVTINQGMRESLLQRFSSPKGDVPLTLVVNHLKSKGSACFEDYPDYASADPLDGQGHCNALRVSAARVLGESLKDLAGDLLLIGDMNAYGMEDPIRVLTDYDPAAQSRQIMSASFTTLAGQPFEESGSALGKGYGFVNLNTRFHGTDTYSYSYEGELGNLDHALANPSLAAKVIGIEDWHINSAESNFFEYGTKYSGQLAKSEGPFSASDHDPVLVAIQYPLPPAGVIALESAAASVEEGSTLSLTVSRRDGTYGEASVSYRIVYGSADASDVAPLTGTLHWGAGESDSQSISIPVKSDTLHEGDETFTLELFDASGAALGDQHQTLVTIKDKLAPSTIALAHPTMSVNEGQWFVEIPLVRTGDLSKPARAKVSLEGITASWGLDFLPWLGQSVSWAAGEGGSKSVKVLIIDDWFVEPTEQFSVNLEKLKGAQPGAVQQTRVDIQDNDKSWWPFGRR
ncbi:ExeM/NucH family extracellular endonuclease [Aeromonas taiwanensis]|uniref:ExeM/NucH family extracellular endonuclease n=1 Tax=Aeromonas taiwanensis TaxID=633417 RepID=UPI00207C8BDF|nr:ExeM/NucH family extracellular endonuclease [Aeromonas taiwanensis]MCO4205683.1 ExeM/NucH family extracellular endonuclease [Aeromonas taiwanensis]